jgi:5-methylcytosine-specific restriction endonuclease McrA
MADPSLQRKTITRKQAKEQNLTKYFTGKPCKRGHVVEREVRNGVCCECRRAQHRNWMARNSAHVKAYAKEYSRNNLEKSAERQRKRRDRDPRVRENEKRYRAENREKCREWNLAWKAKNRIRLATESMAYYCANRESVRSRQRAKIAANPGANRQRVKEWQKANPIKTRAAARRYRERYPDRVRAKGERWRKANPEAVSAIKQRRRARVYGAGGSFTRAQIRDLASNQKLKCATCRTSLRSGYHIDHIVPVSKGGSSWIENIQLLCPKCNRRKADKDPFDWAKENGRLF